MTVARSIRAVTFDVGGTLIEPWPSVGHVYAEVSGRFGMRADCEAMNRGFRAAWAAKRDFDYSHSAWFDLVRRSFGEDVALPAEFFPAVYDRFAEPDVWRVFDDVLPVLATLTDCGVRLAVISNWDERLEPLLDRLNLRRWFESVIVSCELGVTKPSAGIFEHALRKLDLPAGAVLHVGDGGAEDYEGARAAGLNAALIRRKPGNGAVDVIPGLAALPRLLAAG